MTTLLSNDHFQIIQQNQTTFSIEFPIYSETIIQSITKSRILLGTTITNDFHTLIFKASTVKTLPQFKQQLSIANGKATLPIALAAKLAADLGSQLKYMITIFNMTIFGFSPENIIVIDDSKFIYLSSEYLTEINKRNSTIMLCFPIDFKTIFTAPELFQIKEIPSFIHFKVSYYSYGLLLLYALIEDKYFYDNYVRGKENKKEKVPLRNEKIHEYLQSLSIKETKLFWFIERCLVLEPESRSILFL